MDFNNFCTSENGNEYPLQVSYLLIYFNVTWIWCHCHVHDIDELRQRLHRVRKLFLDTQMHRETHIPNRLLYLDHYSGRLVVTR